VASFVDLIMKFSWNLQKNKQLKSERGISFERICVAIEKGHILDILEHTNKRLYSHQLLYVVEIDGYAWVVPFIDDEENQSRILITAFPSREFQKFYLKDKS
jgi:uncharacterized DUF497 family protein